MPLRSDWGSARPTAQETGSGCLYCPAGDGREACTAKKIPRGVTQTLKTETRYRVIYYHREKYTVQEMSTFFEVSRSGYYAWIKRMDQADRDREKMDWIRLVYQENRRIYGYRRVTQALRCNCGVKINHKTVLRLMQKMGLRSVARKRKVYKRLEEIAHYHHYPNLLQRNFSTNRPNQKWVTEPVSSFVFRSKFV